MDSMTESCGGNKEMHRIDYVMLFAQWIITAAVHHAKRFDAQLHLLRLRIGEKIVNGPTVFMKVLSAVRTKHYPYYWFQQVLAQKRALVTSLVDIWNIAPRGQQQKKLV
ncbi:hypothetical protein AB6A40_001641 [Gnathostoma spinigerum]|uniref:Uncharacterized protein n=1 Tax=Gnathostoma spinigerum TaxID=75299 RepID=A0ABD6EEI9_9BILA